jgi:LytS/YehU family sensor histidine kinase
LLNSAGWIILSLVYLFLYYRDALSEPVRVLAVMVTYIIGFLLSLILRLLYRSLGYRLNTISGLTILIIFCSVITAQLWYWIDYLASIPLVGTEELSRMLTVQYYLSISFSRSFPLLIWSILYFMINLWIDWNIQKIRTEKANTLAQTAQLQMLRYQLNPHFLFNALNSIRALIDEDQNNAKSMITELSEFLRYSLISKNYSDVPLKQEMEAVRHYFEIEKKRYEEKLSVHFEIDPLAEEFPVLSFMIHPLVENAVKYGMQTSPMPLKIVISARVKDDILTICVLNSGRWIHPADKTAGEAGGTGTGLINIQQRLENAFPDSHKFKLIEDGDMVGAEIMIKGKLKEQLNAKV